MQPSGRTYDKYRNFKDCLLIDIQRDFFEHLTKRSMVRWNKNTKVCDMYLNIRSEVFYNRRKTELAVQRELKRYLNADAFICVVSTPQKSPKEKAYAGNVQFYFRTEVEPSPKLVKKIPEIVQGCIVPAKFVRIDPVTEDLEILEYSELPDSPQARRLILSACMDPKTVRNGKRQVVDKSWWEFAN